MIKTRENKIFLWAAAIIFIAAVVCAIIYTKISFAKYVVSGGEKNVTVNVVGGISHFFIRGDGDDTQDGSDYDSAVAGWQRVYELVAESKADSKEIIVCGDVTLGTIDFGASVFGYPAVISSLYEGILYSATVTVSGDINIAADTYFNHLSMSAGVSCNVYGNGNNLTFGSNMAISEANLTVYGGADAVENSVESTKIVIESGKYAAVYGGGRLGAVTQSTAVFISGATIGSVYGGGYSSAVGTSDDAAVINVSLTDAAVGGEVYGGGYTSAEVYGDTYVTVTEESNVVGNIYGGGNESSSPVSGNSSVSVRDTVMADSASAEITGSIYGGGYSGATKGNTKVEVTNSRVNNVFGGGYYHGTGASATVNINESSVNAVFGGYDLEGTISGNTSVSVKGSAISTVYGGGNAGTVSGNCVTNVYSGTIAGLYGAGCSGAVSGSSAVNIKDGDISTVYGGGYSGSVAWTQINVLGGSIGTIYGGSNSGSIASTNEKSIKTFIFGGTVGNIIGGSNNAEMSAGAYIYTADCTVTGIIYAAGGNENVSTTCYVYIDSTTKGSGGSVFSDDNVEKGTLYWTEVVYVYYEYDPGAFAYFNPISGLYRWSSPDTPPIAPEL